MCYIKTFFIHYRHTRIMWFKNRTRIHTCANPLDHAIDDEDLDQLRKNPKFPIKTICMRCDKDIRISSDYDEPENAYWVAELSKYKNIKSCQLDGASVSRP